MSTLIQMPNSGDLDVASETIYALWRNTSGMRRGAARR